MCDAPDSTARGNGTQVILKNASPSILMSCIVVLALSGCGRSAVEVAAVPAPSAEATVGLRPTRLRERPDTGLARLEQPTHGAKPSMEPSRFPSDGRAQGAAAIFFFMMLQASQASPHSFQLLNLEPLSDAYIRRSRAPIEPQPAAEPSTTTRSLARQGTRLVRRGDTR